jgi:hypothetical protein
LVGSMTQKQKLLQDQPTIQKLTRFLTREI